MQKSILFVCLLLCHHIVLTNKHDHATKKTKEAIAYNANKQTPKHVQFKKGPAKQHIFKSYRTYNKEEFQYTKTDWDKARIEYQKQLSTQSAFGLTQDEILIIGYLKMLNNIPKYTDYKNQIANFLGYQPTTKRHSNRLKSLQRKQ